MAHEHEMKTFLNILMGICIADAIFNRLVSGSFQAMGKIDLAQLTTLRELAAVVALGVLLNFWRVS